MRPPERVRPPGGRRGRPCTPLVGHHCADEREPTPQQDVRGPADPGIRNEEQPRRSSGPPPAGSPPRLSSLTRRAGQRRSAAFGLCSANTDVRSPSGDSRRRNLALRPRGAAAPAETAGARRPRHPGRSSNPMPHAPGNGANNESPPAGRRRPLLFAGRRRVGAPARGGARPARARMRSRTPPPWRRRVAGLQLRGIGPRAHGRPHRRHRGAPRPAGPPGMWAVGSGGLWKTVNGGTTWSPGLR